MYCILPVDYNIIAQSLSKQSGIVEPVVLQACISISFGELWTDQRFADTCIPLYAVGHLAAKNHHSVGNEIPLPNSGIAVGVIF